MILFILLGENGDTDLSVDYRIGSRKGKEERERERESCSVMPEVNFLAEAASMHSFRVTFDFGYRFMISVLAKLARKLLEIRVALCCSSSLSRQRRYEFLSSAISY